jgi:hypothetical protein
MLAFYFIDLRMLRAILKLVLNSDEITQIANRAAELW